jgi:hypothetical protein
VTGRAPSLALAAVFALLVAVGGIGSARAATVAPGVGRAPAVAGAPAARTWTIDGRALVSLARRDARTGVIRTRSTIQVLRVLSGPAGLPQRIAVTQLGGEVGPIGMLSDGYRPLRRGTRATLQVERRGDGFGLVETAQLGAARSNGRSVSAAGYSYLGVHWAEASLPLRFEVAEQGGPAGSAKAIRAAFDTWQLEGGSSMRFQYAGPTSRRGQVFDGHNVVSWVPIGGGILGQCMVWYKRADLQIGETDIVLDSSKPWGTGGDAFDLQSVITHEAGHTLQLGDLYGPSDIAEVMYFQFGSGEQRRHLGLGDKAGIQAIYPDDTPPRPVRDLAAVGTLDRIRLTWGLPPDKDLVSVRLVRSTAEPASDPSGGPGQEQVYEGLGTAYDDVTAGDGANYYYTAFTRDWAGNWSVAARIEARKGQPCALAAWAVPSLGRYSISPTATGSLTASGTALAARPVSIWKSTDGGYKWSSGGALAFAEVSRTYAWSSALVRNTRFRFLFAGDDILGSAASVPVTVYVRPWLGAPSIASRVRRNRAFTVSGTIRPGHWGSSAVRFFLSKRGRWVYVKTVSAKNKSYGAYSTYRASVRLSTPGRWRALVYHSDGDHYATWGSARYFRVI